MKNEFDKIGNPVIKNLLRQKAKQSISSYRISAIALDKKGDILGKAINRISKFRSENTAEFRGVHAERTLIERYGKAIKTIIIMRIGLGGEIRPIDPCRVCKSIADKMRIKIVSVCPGKGGRGVKTKL